MNVIATGIWVDAHLRKLNECGQGYYVVHKGAYASGMVMVKINLLNKLCKVLVQIRDIDGNLGWMSAIADDLVAESAADAYIHRAVECDPDLWVIEIEDKNGINPFAGKLVI